MLTNKLLFKSILSEWRKRSHNSQVHKLALTISLLSIIILIGCMLRFQGLNWDEGFGYSPHPDERAILFVVEELSFPSLGNLSDLLDSEESSWNPRWFPYGSFPLYLLSLTESVLDVFNGVGSVDLRVPGRIISGAADLVTVLFIFFIGRSIGGRWIGLLASSFVAFAVIHIQLSHFFAVDTLQTMFAVLALWVLIRVARCGGYLNSALAGLFVGLGIATKISQIPILAVFLMAHLMYLLSWNDVASKSLSEVPASSAKYFAQRLKQTAILTSIGLLVTGVVFFLAQPYALLDATRFISDLTEQSEMVRRIRDYPYTRQYIGTMSYWYQITQVSGWGLGWPLGITAWSGLCFASVRGMSKNHIFVYLGVGWLVPIVMLLIFDNTVAIVGASVIAILSLLSTLPARSPETRIDVLILSWVVPYLLITGSFEVKFMRYMLPVTPFLLFFGARLMIAMCSYKASKSMKYHIPLTFGIRGMLVVVLLSSVLYAFAFSNVYEEKHTAVRASEWLQNEAPPGAFVLKEHWEESIPGLGKYRIYELPMYDPDNRSKEELLATRLAEADYFILFSNRLYGTIPRISERYPASSKLYKGLFSGHLGYELVNYESEYPNLWGISLVDDTFTRPGLPEPAGLMPIKSGRAINLGYADESFSVYDHPKVLIFENIEKYETAELLRVFSTSQEVLGKQDAFNEIGDPLMFSSEEFEFYRQGGTWTEIIDESNWASNVPILAWLLLIYIISLLSAPLGFLVFKSLPDKGYMFSKVLGLLLVGLAVWLITSLNLMVFSKFAIVVTLVGLGVVSGITFLRYRYDICDFIRSHWRVILTGEVLFILSFLIFVIIRMVNPDLWHPYRGGEKPMELAYLNAVIRSSYMPPFDPWFAGGYLNYYYWGYFITAIFIKLTSLPTAIGFNLAVPMFFALTTGLSFSLVYNLAESSEQTGRFQKSTPVVNGPNFFGRFKSSTIWAGLLGVFFVAIMGNFDGVKQMLGGFKRLLFQDLPFGEFDFWRSSRMMPPDPPGYEITEFPFFTFLFADLHAHMMAIPFTLLVLGMGLCCVLYARKSTSMKFLDKNILLTLFALGACVGSLRLLNAWDFPTYFIVASGSILIAEYYLFGGMSIVMLARAFSKIVVMAVVGYVVFLPFHMTNEVFFNSLEMTTNTTKISQFLSIMGLFVFVVGSFLLFDVRHKLIRILFFAGWVYSGTGQSYGSDKLSAFKSSGLNFILGLFLVALLIFCAVFANTFLELGYTTLSVLVLLGLGAWSMTRWMRSNKRDAPSVSFSLLLVIIAFSLVVGLEFFRMEGDIERMNSVFKFYLQIWILLGIASAYLVWRLGFSEESMRFDGNIFTKSVLLLFVLLMIGGSIYPIFGTHDRLRDRFDVDSIPMTLDGTDYVRGTTYFDPLGDIDIEIDFEGIRWLRENVDGTPVILEAVTPTYRWGSRVSINTGLPTVVGWQWHQEQQRWGYRHKVTQRIMDVKNIYETVDIEEAKSLLRQYNVGLVYVGRVEKLYFSEEGLEKFDNQLSGVLTKIFQNEDVEIYEVKEQF